MFVEPNVTLEVTTTDNPISHQPLILQCSVTIVNSITNTFDIIWSTDNTQVRRVNNITAISNVNSSFIYNDSLIIPLLNISDIGSVYQCEVVINSILYNTDFIIPIPGTY